MPTIFLIQHICMCLYILNLCYSHVHNVYIVFFHVSFSVKKITKHNDIEDGVDSLNFYLSTDINYAQKASKMRHQKDMMWKTIFILLYTTGERKRDRVWVKTRKISLPFKFNVSVLLSALLSNISHRTPCSFTYCQWLVPYKILAKHAGSPLHYWENPCSHSPS